MLAGAKQSLASGRRAADLQTAQKVQLKQAGLADFKRGQAQDLQRSLALNREQAAARQRVWQEQKQLDEELEDARQCDQAGLTATACRVQGPGLWP